MNTLFLKSQTLKFKDLVKFKTAQIMYTARNHLLLGNIQKMFCDSEGSYNLREKLNLKKHCVRTTMKSLCISVGALDLWNGLGEKLKGCINIKHFKKMHRTQILRGCADEEGIC